MPELPEVEIVRRGLFPALIHQTIEKVIIRNDRLRWPIVKELPKKLAHLTILDIRRRGKYLLFEMPLGTLILHLGMSGRVQLFKEAPTPSLHDHVDIIFTHHLTLRYTDPRRFGSLIWTEQPPENYPLLAHLGVEPLSRQFTGDYLYQKAQGRKIPVKSFLMDNKIVVGIGNIYASESLFLAKISPLTPAGQVSKTRYQRLAKASDQVLQKAIQAGGSTLKDFQNAEGQPGYFTLKLQVYGREGLPCPRCKTALVKAIINQRTSTYCPHCQTK